MRLFSLFLLLFSTQLLAEEYAPAEMPRSMVRKLTEPIADIEVENCYFKSGKSDLSASDKETLRALAEKLRGLPVYILVEAYTDGDGSAEFNQILSEKRAKSASAVMVHALGLHRNQVISSGFGKTFASAQTSTEKSQERRVVVTVLKKNSEKAKTGEILSKLRARGVHFTPRGEKLAVETAKKLKEDPYDISLHVSIHRSAVISSDANLSAQSSFGAIFELWPWWPTEDLYTLFVLSQADCGATYKNLKGTLSKTTIGGGVGKQIFRKDFVSINSSLTLNVTNYSFAEKQELELSDDSTDVVVSTSDSAAVTEELSQTHPSIGAKIEVFGYPPKTSIALKLGFRILTDQLTTSAGIFFGGAYHW